jgi:serine/threonine-protein kinase
MPFVLAVLNLSLLFGSLALARANLRAGRGDRRGAARAIGFTTIVWLAAWALAARHYLSLPIERDHFFDFLAYALFNVGVLWVLYLALEPYVRRFTPEILISWTRVLSGQLRDPRVGRDVLAGVAVGVGMTIVALAFTFVPAWIGRPPARPVATNLAYLMETRIAAGAVLRVIPNGLGNAMAIAVLFVMGRALTRSTWGGAIVAILVLVVFVFTEALEDSMPLALLFALIFSAPIVGVLVRFGLLAEAVAFFVNQVLNNTPLTLDFSRPYASGALIPMIFVVSLAAFGYWAARGDRPLFGHLLQTDP